MYLFLYTTHYLSSGSRILVRGDIKQNLIHEFHSNLYCNGIAKISVGGTFSKNVRIKDLKKLRSL